MINEKTVFDQPVKIDERTYNNVQITYKYSWRWLYNWLFAKLSLFQKILLDDGNGLG